MALKLVEVKKNITKTESYITFILYQFNGEIMNFNFFIIYVDLVRWWFHRQQFRARELAIDEAYRLREQQEIELEQHRLQILEKLWKRN